MIKPNKSSIYLFSSIFAASLSFITLPLYTKFLSPEDYGIITLFLLFSNVSSSFLSIGIHKATFRFFFKYESDFEFFSKINSSNLIFLFFIFSFFGLLVYLSSNVISIEVFDQKISSKLIELSFLSGFFQSIYIYFTTLLNAEEKASTFAFFTIFKPILDIIISMSLLFLGSYTFLAKIYGHFFSQLTSVALLIIIYRKFISYTFSLSAFNKSFKFALPQIPNNMLGYVHQSFDKLMLTNYSSLPALTHYSFGANFAMPIKMIMDAIARSWNPFFLKEAEKNNGKIEEIENPLYTNLSLIFICGLILSFFSEELIQLLTNENFHFSKYIAPSYILYYLLGSIGFLSLPQMMYGEKMAYTIPISFLNVLINISFNFLLIPIYGSVGAVISILLSAFAVAFFQYFFGQKSMPLKLDKIKLISFFLIYFTFFIISYALLLSSLDLFYKVIIKISLIYLYALILSYFNYFSFKKIIQYKKQ